MTSAGPFLCYREIIPATSVEIAKFFTFQQYGEFLVTLTSSVINIYKVHTSAVPHDNVIATSSSQKDGSFLSTLLHVKLFGKPHDVNTYCDETNCYMILNFDAGKMSVARFDPVTCTLDISGLYNAEENAIGTGAEVQATTQGRIIPTAIGMTPYVAVDPVGAVACGLIYGQQFLFVALASPLEDNNTIPHGSIGISRSNNIAAAGLGRKSSAPKQFIVDLLQHLRLVGPVVDYCFLTGYSRPTIAILQEHAPLPIGHLAAVRNTCSLAVVAVDMVTKSASLVWRQRKLPHDCVRILPLSHASLQGSVAVISMNAVLIVSENAIVGTATCGFASTSVDSSNIKLHATKLPQGLELDASRWIEANENTLVGSLKDGKLLAVSILMTPETLIHDIRFECVLLASSIRCSCFCRSSQGNLWFLGSRAAFCLLLEATWSETSSALINNEDKSDSAKDTTIAASSIVLSPPALPASKKARRSTAFSSSSTPNVSNGNGDQSQVVHVTMADVEEEEKALYGAPLTLPASLAGGAATLLGNLSVQGSSVTASGNNLCTLRVVDTISVLGPVVDGLFCANDETMDQVDNIEWENVVHQKATTNPASAYIVDREAKDALQLYTGLDEQGGIYRIGRGMRVSKLASRNFPGAFAVQSLVITTPTTITMGINGSVSVGSSSSSGSSTPVVASSSYSIFFLSFPDKTRVFQSGIVGPSTSSTSTAASTGGGGVGSDISVKELSVSDAGFVATSSTLCVGWVAPMVAVQVASHCVRVVRMSSQHGLVTGEPLQDVVVADSQEVGGLGGIVGESIVYADVCQAWIALLTSNGSVYVLEYDVSEENLLLRYAGRRKDEVNQTDDAMEIEKVSDTTSQIDHLLHVHTNSVSLFYGSIPEEQEILSSLPLSIPMDTDGNHGNADDTRTEDAGTGQNSINQMSLVERLQHLEEMFLYGKEGIHGRPNDGMSDGKVGDEKIAEEMHGVGMDVSDDANPSELEPPPETTKKGKKGKTTAAAKKNGAATGSNNKSSTTNTTSTANNGGATAAASSSSSSSSTPRIDDMHLVIASATGTISMLRLRDKRRVLHIENAGSLPSKFPLFSSSSPSSTKDTAIPTAMNTTTTTTTTTPAAAVSTNVQSSIKSPSQQPRSSLHTNGRGLVDVRFAVIGPNDGPIELSRLCLVMVLDTSDVCVYYLHEAINTTTSMTPASAIITDTTKHNHTYFLKLEHSVVTRKRRSRRERRKALEGGIDGNNTTATLGGAGLASTGPGLGLGLAEEVAGGAQRIRFATNFDGKSALLVSGGRPVVVSNADGLPFVVPLGLPELPFANNGSHLLAPFAVGTTVMKSSLSLHHANGSGSDSASSNDHSDTGTNPLGSVNTLIQGLASLWLEHDESMVGDGTGGVAAGGYLETKHNPHRQTTLQLYQQIPGLQCFPNSVATARRVHVGVTTHSCTELLPRSDDRTEQALLKRRTFVLACSQEVKSPFLHDVLTQKERQIETENYDRFYTSLDSFCQPDATIAPPPMLSSRQHKLVVMQNGTAVDTYTLPLREHILGIEPLYLTLTTTTVVPSLVPMQPPMTLTNKTKRVFLAVCTCVEDKHGEDTQGEGRLLLFGLDYALFQDDSTATIPEPIVVVAPEETTAAAVTTASILASAGLTNVTVSASGTVMVGGQNAGVTRHSTAEETKFFNAIQPKLKLLWSGPGPASVVKQIGEYLISTVATTIYIYKLNPETLELVQVNFFFAQFFISSVSVIKNYILIADVCNSVQFLVWREEDESLTLVSKDMDTQTILSTAFITDGPALGMMVGDDEGNIQMMKYDPRKVETKDGSRLLCLADFHLGSDATLLLTHPLLHAPVSTSSGQLPPLPPSTHPPLPPLPPPKPGMSMSQYNQGGPVATLPMVVPVQQQRRSRGGKSYNTSAQPFGQRFEKIAPLGSHGHRSCVLTGTIDGGIGLFVPVEERTHRRLALLQQLMSMGVPTPCALNPRDYRLLKASRFVAQRQKGVLDGALLWKFVSLDSALQDDLAAAMGVTTDAILENLLDIDMVSSFF